MSQIRYTHGHHESVLKSHEWRNISNSCRYFEDYLEPGKNVIDIGCGPGTITVDIAKRVFPGKVLGIDMSEGIVAKAKSYALEAEVENIEFIVGDIYNLSNLSQDLGGFDICHAHQLLQHVHDPVGALKNMAMTVKKGGIVACRDSDYGAMTFYPHSEGLEKWRKVYSNLARSCGGEPNAGRHILSWANEAGFSSIIPSASIWCFATQKDREFWGGMWAERVILSDFASQVLERNLASESELYEMKNSWEVWKNDRDGWLVVVAGEVIVKI